MNAALSTFFHDDKVKAILLLIVLDFALGVLAALKKGNFRLSYMADFARNDVAFKVVPYFFVYYGALVAGGAGVVIPGLDLGDIAGASYVALVAAFVGSILSSANELRAEQPKGFGSQSMVTALAGKENEAPPRS